ncbi:MAG: hypothetical protein ACTSX9_09490 [Candidatus Njordarchaeales archaeon]
MGLFKKKLEINEAKKVLENVIAEIIKQSGLTLNDLVKSMAEKIGLASIPIKIPEISDVHKVLAKTIVSGIKDERAYEALKEIKKLLDKYKL